MTTTVDFTTVDPAARPPTRTDPAEVEQFPRPAEWQPVVPLTTESPVEPTKNTNKQTRLPTAAQLVNFIENDGFQQVLRKYQNRRFLTLTEDRLVLDHIKDEITQGQTFIRQPDDTVQCWEESPFEPFGQSFGMLFTKLIDPPTPKSRKRNENGFAEGSDNPFHTTWYTLKQDITTSLENTIFPMAGLKNRPKTVLFVIDQPETGDTFPMDLKHLLTAKEVNAAINRAAKGVLATMGNGGVRQPTALGYHLLYQLIGKDNVSLTIKMAGQHANLFTFNVIMRNRAVLSEASQINPNAVSLWLSNLKGENHPVINTPEQVIKEARAAYQKQLNQYLTENKAAWIRRYDSAAIWQAFSSLNHTATAKYMLHPKSKTEQKFLIPALVHAAQANPPYSTIEQLVFQHQQPKKNYLPFTIEYIRECAALAKRPRPGQTLTNLHQQYAGGFNHLQESVGYSNQKNDEVKPKEETCQPLADLTNRANSQHVTWSEWMDKMPSSIREPERPPATSRKPRPKAERTKPRSSTETERLHQIITGPAHRSIRKILEHPVARVYHQADRSVSFRLQGQRNPILQISRNDDGSLTLNTGPEYWSSPNQQLPNPSGAEPHQDQAWTTRGFALAHTTSPVHDHLRQNWNAYRQKPTDLPPNFQQVQQSMLKVFPSLSNLDQELSDQLIKAIRNILDQDTYDRAFQISQVASVKSYNLAATAQSFLPELTRTNPGAVTWYLKICPAAEPIRHPGQLITETRRNMTKYGLDPTNWGTAATAISQEDMTNLIAIKNNPADVAQLINAVADSNDEINLPILQTAANFFLTFANEITEDLAEMTDPEDERPTQNGLQRRNRCRAIILYYRDRLDLERKQTSPPTEPAAQNDLFQVRDYVDAISTAGVLIKSTTWKGLHKQSVRWHRQFRNGALNAARWEKTIETQGGRYLAWNSLLETQSIRKLKIVPLCSQQELQEETVAMDNCVFQYASRCAQGKTRIFSVRKNDNRVATSEITLKNGEWLPTQTQTKGNNTPDPTAVAAMREVARQYTNAYRGSSQQSTKAWYIDLKTETFAGNYDEERPVPSQQAA